MKVVQLSSFCSATGGVGKYLMRLCPALQDAGHQVVLIHSDREAQKKSIPGIDEQYYVEGLEDYENDETNVTSAAAVMDLLKVIEPDIVHIQNNNNFLLEEDLRKSYPVIKSLHVYDFCPSGNKFHQGTNTVCRYATGLMCIPRMAYKRCTLSKRPQVIFGFYKLAMRVKRNDAGYCKMIVASEYVRQRAIESGYRLDQLEVVPYFTPLPRLHGTAKDKTKTIFLTGRIVAEKGWPVLLKALELLPEEIDWKLIVDGDGQELEKMKREAGKMPFHKKVEFPGWLNPERHEACFQKADVVVVPSLWPEPFGLVGIEAMSYGKPVVAFAVGGIPEWLENGAVGFLIPPYDHAEMAKKIQYLLEHPAEAEEMGRRGRKRAEEAFNAEKHILRLEEIYRKVSGILKER